MSLTSPLWFPFKSKHWNIRNIPQKLWIHRRRYAGNSLGCSWRLFLMLRYCAVLRAFHPPFLSSCNSTPVSLMSWLRAAWCDGRCLRKISSDTAITIELGRSYFGSHDMHWNVCAPVAVCLFRLIHLFSLCSSALYVLHFCCVWQEHRFLHVFMCGLPKSTTCGHG